MQVVPLACIAKDWPLLLKARLPYSIQHRMTTRVLAVSNQCHCERGSCRQCGTCDGEWIPATVQAELACYVGMPCVMALDIAIVPRQRFMHDSGHCKPTFMNRRFRWQSSSITRQSQDP